MWNASGTHPVKKGTFMWCMQKPGVQLTNFSDFISTSLHGFHFPSGTHCCLPECTKTAPMCTAHSKHTLKEALRPDAYGSTRCEAFNSWQQLANPWRFKRFSARRVEGISPTPRDRPDTTPIMAKICKTGTRRRILKFLAPSHF